MEKNIQSYHNIKKKLDPTSINNSWKIFNIPERYQETHNTIDKKNTRLYR